MTPFLTLVAQDIYERFGNEMNKICVVFPNRRSILFFNKYLSQVVKKPVWAPKCVTITDFIQGFSNLIKADELMLVFDLYRVYCKVRKVSEPFDNFYHWGELMLSDFDEIDKYMVDAQSLFQNLSALKNINEYFSYLDEKQLEAIQQFWKNFGQSRNSEHHKAFADIWSSMYSIYENFKNTIINEKGFAYEGLIYRQVAESVIDNTFVIPDYKKICFVGFNALNKCEKTVFTHLKVNARALFYWDYSSDYIQQPFNEAGFFLRQNLAEFPSALDEKYFHNLEKPKSIELIAIPSNTGQAKVAGQIAEGLCRETSKLEKTAILLPDESLLMPVLHSISPNVSNINITMGYPVKDAPVIALIEAIGQLYTKAKTDNDNKNTRYFYKNIIEILSHPYIERDNAEELKKFKLDIVNRNIIYVEPSKLPHNELIDLVFHQPSNGKAFIEQLAKIIKIIGRKSNNDDSSTTEQPAGIESETLMIVYGAINRFADLMANYNLPFDIPLSYRLLLKILNGLTIPFEGEPLKGLQVMGFLESRAIDFENVIVLSINESILPKANLPVSFIPYNLRRGYNLPTLEHRDAIYAYYFYRILQRAKHVHLLYNTATDKMGGSEMSRYATQLLYNKDYKVIRKAQSFNIELPVIPKIVIDKTSEIIEILKKYNYGLDNGAYLSPSAMSSYIDCRLRFYFRYIENLREHETITEEIDAPLLGSILHRAMFIVYKSFLNTGLQKTDLSNILKNKEIIENAVYEAISNEYFKETAPQGKTLLQGRNFIIFKIINKYVRQIIEIDSQFAPLTIIELEKKIISPFIIDAHSGNLNISIGGYIDRIDQTLDGIRIIDYKTGNVETKFNQFEDLFNPAGSRKAKKEILQAFLYSVLYKAINKTDKKIIPSIYSLRKIFGERFDPLIYKEKQAINDIVEIEDTFKEHLKMALEEIFNPAIPFVQTSDLDKCKNCAYNIICHRENDK